MPPTLPHNDQDLFGTPAEYAQSAVEHGTVGHEGDTDENYFDAATDDPGGTVVNVTLFRGRNHDEPLKGDVAQGMPIACRLAGPWMGVPARGAQCIVLLPNGFDDVHGVGVIVAAQGNPRDAMNKSYVRHGTDGSVTLGATSAEGLAVFFRVGPEGFLFQSPWVIVRLDTTGFHIRHVSGAGIDGGAISGVPVLDTAVKHSVSLTGDMVSLDGKIIGAGPPVGTHGVAEPTAKATTLLTVLASIQAEHTAAFDLFTALAAVSAVPGTAPAVDPAVILAFTALTTAMSSTAAALTAAALTLPSESTMVM